MHYYVNIIVFKDETLQILADKQQQDDFQEGARCYRVKETVQLMDILEWQINNREHRDFKQVW